MSRYLIEMLVNPILNKINLMFSQCVIKIVTDKNKTQTIQTELQDGEVREKVERWQEYGFTCNPPSNSEALCLFLGGERDRGFIIATENKNYRVLNLKEGEVCLYTHEKDKIHFQNENRLLIQTKEFSIEDKKHMLTAEESVAVKTKDFSLNNKNFTLQSDQKTSIQTKTFAVSNGSAELIDIISQTLEILSTTTVNTCSGPMPLKDFAKLQKLKIQIDTFKS